LGVLSAELQDTEYSVKDNFSCPVEEEKKGILPIGMSVML
jgi:hypothetical protein